MNWYSTSSKERPNHLNQVMCILNTDKGRVVTKYMYCHWPDEECWSDGFCHHSFDKVEAWCYIDSLIEDYLHSILF